MSQLPKAVLLDLDDTILNDSGNTAQCWRESCLTFRSELAGANPEELIKAIDRTRAWYWADPERHRIGRLGLGAAHREIVKMALTELGLDDSALAGKIAETYSDRRDARLTPFPDAIDTVRWLRRCGCRLALLTNGSATAQRGKIARFDLQGLFDAVFIEGELGFGKPDRRIYELALRELMVAAPEAWMVGDNLEWDVIQPQKMGVFAIWVDVRGTGLPKTATVRPSRIVRALSELRASGDREAS